MDGELAALAAVNTLYASRAAVERLLREYGTLEAAWEEFPARRDSSPLAARMTPSVLEAGRKETEEAERRGVLMLPFWDPRYPRLLGAIANPPPLLYVLGDAEALHGNCIAMVGSRTTSFYGRRAAAGLSAALAERGYTVVSGLARGIDRECHAAALDAGGKTVAVLGSGVLRVYPKENEQLAEAVAANGAVVSEFPLRAKPVRFHFPRRNRVISGLSLATVVVEAGRRSGALITATWAAEQGREVFALPGPVDTGFSAGCHQLLREGARVVESVEDIEADLSGLKALFAGAGDAAGATGEKAPVMLDRAGARRKLLLEAMGYGGADIEKLEEQTGLPAETMLPLLMELELEGIVARKAGGIYARRK